MTTAQQIVEHAFSLLDIVGISRLSSGDNLLILGLESTPEHDLDEFGLLDGNCRMYGFEKHVEPKLESLLGRKARPETPTAWFSVSFA